MSSRKVAFRLPVLGIVLGLQVLIAAVLFWGSEESIIAVNEPLLTIDWESVDGVVITNEEGESVNLREEDGQWLMGEGVPIIPTRIVNLLGSLRDLKTAWPVASSESAGERFEVTENKFRRKISLYAGEQALQTVLIGTSPGFNQSHISLPTEEDIFALQFSVFDAPTDEESWLDNTLLRPEGELLSITYGDHTVEKKDGKWPKAEKERADTDSASAEGEPATDEELAAVEAQGESGDKAAPKPAFDAARFSAALRDLRVAGLADDVTNSEAEVNDSGGDDQVTSIVTWSVRTDENSYDYELLEKGDQHLIRRSDFPQTFRLSRNHFDSLMEVQKNL